MNRSRWSLTWGQSLAICGVVILIGVLTVAGIGAVLLLGPPSRNDKPYMAAIGLGGAIATLVIPAIMQHRFATSRKERSMSALTGTEPDHWHDADGHHRMKDPRKIPGWDWKKKSRNWSDADERAYVQHLIDHETPAPERAMDPVEAQPDDSAAARALIDTIKTTQATLATCHELLATLRLRDRLAARSEETDHDR